MHSTTDHRISGWRTWAAVTVLVATVYLLYGTHFGGRVSMPVHPNGVGTYDALAEAMLNGRLDVTMAPDDARVQAIRFDISVCRDRYYLYWGAAPVVLLYVPFRAVFGRGLPDLGALFTFLFGTYIFGSLLLLRIHARCGKHLGPLSLACALAVLGLANLSLYMIKQLRIYEVAAAGGVFFFLGGLCLLGHWWLDQEDPAMSGASGNGKLAMASLFFGLCLLTRPSHVFAILACLAMTTGHLFLHTGRDRLFATRLACLAAPVVVCFGLWCTYNWIRFDQWLETGQSLPPNGLPSRLFYLRGTLRGFYLQVLQPPLLSLHPPFIRSRSLDTAAKALTFGLPGYAYNTIGLFFLSPFVLILPVSAWRAVRPPSTGFGTGHRPALTFIRRALGVSLGATLLVMLCFSFNDLRYPSDYLTTGLLLSALAWFSWLEKANAGAAGSGRRSGRALGIAAAMTVASALSVAVHLVVGFFLY